MTEPDEKRSEASRAFVEPKPCESIEEAEALERHRDRMAGFKRSKRAVIGEAPKTSAGKIRKFVPRKPMERRLERPGTRCARTST